MDNEKVFKNKNVKNLWNCIKLNSKVSKAQAIIIEPKKPILYIIMNHEFLCCPSQPSP
jgi:hypothetical protein